MNRATLSCKHAVDVPATVEVDEKVDCPKCPETAKGTVPRRTVKAIVRPTGDDVVDAAMAGLADELSSDAVAEVVASEVTPEPEPVETVATVTPVGDRTKARQDRLDRAKAAAANGGDAAAILAEPLPEGNGTGNRRGRTPTRVCFLNLSRVRVGALVAAGFAADRLEGATVDLQADDVRFLLAELPKVCEADGPFKSAACRTADWLERFREQVAE